MSGGGDKGDYKWIHIRLSFPKSVLVLVICYSTRGMKSFGMVRVPVGD